MANVLKNMNMFMDGRNYAGKATSLTPPALTLITEEFRPGGRDLAEKIDVGMEPLEPSFELADYDPELFKQFGWKKDGPVALVFHGATQSDEGKVVRVKITMRGRIISIERDSWETGKIAPTTVTVNAVYYKEEIGSETVVEIDSKNMKRIIGGEDQLAEQRAALGF